ncbi:flagellin [Vreelandella arcis]
MVAAVSSDIGDGPISDVTYEANGKQTGIEVDAAGNLSAENGDKLYIESGVLTSSPTGGTPSQATKDELVELLATTDGAKLSVGEKTYETTTQHVTGTAAGTISVTGLTASSEDVMEEVETNVSGTTAVTYGGASGSVVTGSVALNAEGKSTTQFVDPDGNFTTDATSNVTYELDGDVVNQTSGTQAGSQAYIAADGSVTTDATMPGERTENPLAALDSALKQVDSLRSELGAVQNRFESAITNLSTNETNLSAARSRIEDADYATEVANMTKNQILQQAGTSVLAQANQLPQSVLSLLG